MYSERNPMHDTVRSMAVEASQRDRARGRGPKWTKKGSILTGVILLLMHLTGRRTIS